MWPNKSLPTPSVCASFECNYQSKGNDYDDHELNELSRSVLMGGGLLGGGGARAAPGTVTGTGGGGCLAGGGGAVLWLPF